MRFFDKLKNLKKKDTPATAKENTDKTLQQALILSREGKHTEAYPIFEYLYNKNRNAVNTFNLFQCAVYCGKAEVENELYKELKCYSPDPKKEPIELSGAFVRYYYGIILCNVNRNKEAVEIVDYLIDVISHCKITDPTFLYIRGIPTAQMIYTLIKNTFADDETQLKEYKNKLVSFLDNDTKKHDFTDN